MNDTKTKKYIRKIEAIWDGKKTRKKHNQIDLIFCQQSSVSRSRYLKLHLSICDEPDEHVPSWGNQVLFRVQPYSRWEFHRSMITTRCIWRASKRWGPLREDTILHPTKCVHFRKGERCQYCRCTDWVFWILWLGILDPSCTKRQVLVRTLPFNNLSDTTFAVGRRTHGSLSLCAFMNTEM